MDDLADDVLVGEADDEAVLGRIVLVLRLGDQSLTRIVVGCTLLDARFRWAWRVGRRTFTLTAAPVLDLVPREVRVVLLKLGLFPESAICASNPHSKQLAETPSDRMSKRGCTHNEAEEEIACAIQSILTVGILTGCSPVSYLRSAEEVRKFVRWARIWKALCGEARAL